MRVRTTVSATARADKIMLLTILLVILVIYILTESKTNIVFYGGVQLMVKMFDLLEWERKVSHHNLSNKTSNVVSLESNLAE